MRKEVFLAIIIGFSVGLLITFGVWKTKKILKETGPTTTEKPSPSVWVEDKEFPTPTAKESLLTIISPEDNFLSNKEKIEIKGKTLPEATVVIIYEEGEKIIEADEEGDFTTEITLAGGSNEINVSVYDKEGNEASQTLNVVYSTAEL